VTQLGSHKITVSRHDFIYGAAYMEEHDKEASFNYKGFSLSSGQFKVVVKDEKVFVNGQDYGQLSDGDSMSITDEGVRVNSLDYGETAKYLRTNSEQARR
jgi:glutamine cyclotransferase